MSAGEAPRGMPIAMGAPGPPPSTTKTPTAPPATARGLRTVPLPDSSPPLLLSADRVAPIVARRRRQRVARAQLEMLRDFVDLDIGFDPDFAPHPDDRLDHLVILRLEPARRLDRDLDRPPRREAALGKQAFCQFGIVRHLDRGIQGGVARRFQRRARNP